MISGFIARKGQMTSVYTPEGKRIAVTRLTASPLTVTQVKNIDKDGYVAVQVAYGNKKRLDQSTSLKLKKLKLEITPRQFKEFALTADSAPEVGTQITPDLVLAAGDGINVTGVSKGRGFAGVIKRYGFRRQPVSGGQSDRVRAPGSIGAQTPGKVIKGKKMPGHYGNATAHVANLTVFAIDTEKNEILVSGSVPGHFNSYVTIYKNQ